jgi:hypothetical protein
MNAPDKGASLSERKGNSVSVRREKIVRSPKLIAKLEAAGCYRLRTNADGTAVFSETGTVLRAIKEYVDAVDLARARASFKNAPPRVAGNSR